MGHIICPYLWLTSQEIFREKFASRKRVANYRGSNRNDWWSVDFDLAELKELRLKLGITTVRMSFRVIHMI